MSFCSYFYKYLLQPLKLIEILFKSQVTRSIINSTGLNPVLKSSKLLHIKVFRGKQIQTQIVWIG